MIISSNAGIFGNWLQVNLGSFTRVISTIAQGSDPYNEWVESFTVAYTNSTSSLTTIQDENGNKVFCFKNPKTKQLKTLFSLSLQKITF